MSGTTSMKSSHHRARSASSQVPASGLRPIARFALDAAFGLAAFLAVAALLVYGNTVAQAQTLAADIVTFAPGSAALGQQFLAQLPLASDPGAASWLPGYVFRRTDSSVATLVLALVFAVLTALNIAFWRHVMQAYAPERRRRHR